MPDIMEIETADALLEYLPPPERALDDDTAELSVIAMAGDVEATEDFSQRLLRALATMAVRSKRRQADLAAALCRGGLEREAREVGPALRTLEDSGYIEQIVPLYDGGVLMSVTSRGIEQLSTLPRWAMLDGAMRLG